MLHAKDLMIGDWLYMECTEDGIAPYDMLTQWAKEDFGFSDTFIETHIHPVPLTPEILEKNGFSGEGYHMGIVGFSKEPIPDVKDGYEVFIWKDMCLQIKHGFTHLKKYVKYVHELQHALRLCGIEKNIEL